MDIINNKLLINRTKKALALSPCYLYNIVWLRVQKMFSVIAGEQSLIRSHASGEPCRRHDTMFTDDFIGVYFVINQFRQQGCQGGRAGCEAKQSTLPEGFVTNEKKNPDFTVGILKYFSLFWWQNYVLIVLFQRDCDAVHSQSKWFSPVGFCN